MKYAVPVLAAMLLIFGAANLSAEEPSAGPTDPKAQKTFQQGLDYLNRHMVREALSNFKKADKQDGAHCIVCQQKMLQIAVQLEDWDTAEQAAAELVTELQEKKELAIAHHQLGQILLNKGLVREKEDLFRRAHEEEAKALESYPQFPSAVLLDGRALAYLKQDEAAKQQFQRYVQMLPDGDVGRERVLRFIERPELARARMAPPFAVTTLDGQRISLDDLKGKVVLIDFWATWCPPCREALPHIQSIAKKYAGQPLVILSVSLDPDEQKWKDFIAKNNMTWPQCRDGNFGGTLAQSFSVHAIPHTFTIDVDGVLQDEQLGDASIEGKLKKLLRQAGKTETPKLETKKLEAN